MQRRGATVAEFLNDNFLPVSPLQCSYRFYKRRLMTAEAMLVLPRYYVPYIPSVLGPS